MEYRKGICGDCNAEYKLPPSFAADKAKCKQCGGVVAVGEVEKAEPPAPARSQPKPEPVPAKKPTAAKRPAQAPPKKVAEAGEEAPRKRREGPSMKEQLLARRQAEAAAADSGSSPAKPAAKKASASTAAGKRPAAGKPATRKPAAASSAKPTRAAGSTSRRGATSRRGKDADDGDEGRPARGRRQQKQGNPALLWGSLAAVVVAIAGWMVMMGGDEPAPAEENTAQAGAGAEQSPESTAPAGEEAGGDTGEATAEAAQPTAPEASNPAEETTPAAEGAGADDAAATEEEPEDEPEGPATEAPRNAATGRYKVFMLDRQPKTAAKYPDALYDPKDPAEPQIATYQPFETPPGTDAAEWENIMDLARTMIDPDAGAAGNRAAIALEKIGKPAFPAIINVMLTLDYSTKDGNQAGDVCQRSLQNIANGRNVGWYHSYRQEPNKTAIQNTRCVDILYEQVWGRELREPGYFERYAKLNETEKPAEEAAPTDDGLDDALDDLDF